MVVTATEALNPNSGMVDGVRFQDRYEPNTFLDAMPQEPSGNIELEISVEDGENEADGLFVSLSPDQRRTLAAVLLGMPVNPHGTGQPVQNVGKMRVVMETGDDDWAIKPEDFDYLWARAGWHVRNGIPGFLTHPAGGSVAIHEVGEGENAPRGMSETRRHYRYRLEGDKPGSWRFHNNYNYIRRLNPVALEMQRSYRSDWKKA